MTQANIDTDEWLTVWDSTSQLENKYKELQTENRILEDWIKRLEFRIQQIEDWHGGVIQ